jgi:6-phosphofructokinase 1
MVSVQNGEFVPVPFATMINPETGRTRVRRVDVTAQRYAIAHRYMFRLRHEDFTDPHELSRLASTVGLSPEEFTREFGYLGDHPAVGQAVDFIPATRR